jgi:hypothetical protein
MNNSLKLLLIACAASIAGTDYYSPTPQPATEGYVAVLLDEATYEYAPPVTVAVVHDEVVINGLRAN